MAKAADRTVDVREGSIETIDFETRRGHIEITNAENGGPLSRIPFDVAELKVAREDLNYVEKNTKVTFKVRPDELWGLRACEVHPIENELCYARIYGVAEDYCRVFIFKNEKLANVNLETLKHVVPHHLCLADIEHCIVAVPWREISKADREKRFPVVDLLEVHESKEEAQAALKHKITRKSGTTESATNARVEEGATARKPTAGLRGIESGSPQSSQDHRLGFDENLREGIPGPVATPTRDQLQMAYWSGVRDGASRYQHYLAPYYAALDHFLNEPPIKCSLASHVCHRN